MDQLFDRLTDLLRSMGQRDSASGRTGADADEAAAWDELNDYLGGESGEAGGRSHSGTHDAGFRGQQHQHGGAGYGTAGRSGGSSGRSGGVPESLRKDFANLELPFGASLEAARAAHRRLIRAYHPDRHATNPDKYRIATQITQRVNHSFQRVKQFYEHGVRPDDHGG